MTRYDGEGASAFDESGFATRPRRLFRRPPHVTTRDEAPQRGELGVWGRWGLLSRNLLHLSRLGLTDNESRNKYGLFELAVPLYRRVCYSRALAIADSFNLVSRLRLFQPMRHVGNQSNR